jgi:amino acid adenylation domain-containing protein
MDTSRLIRELCLRGVELWSDSGRLCYRSRKGALPEEKLADLRRLKPQLLDVLCGRRAVSVPLSSGQEALLFHQQTWPHSRSYNLPTALLVEGIEDQAVIGSALRALAKRHLILGSRIEFANGEPLLSLDPDRVPDVVWEDASGFSPERLQQRLAAESDRPFSLSAEAPVRFLVLHLGSGTYCLMMCLHHIITDGMSMTILIDDLMNLLSGQPLAACAENTFLEFLLSHFSYLASEECRQDESFWNQQLQAPLPVLDLPTDYARPTAPLQRSASRRLQVGTQLTARMKQRAKDEGTTLAAMVLSCWFVLLHRYTGQQDLICAMPDVGRDSARFRRMVGYFVNMLPVRVCVDPMQSARSFVQDVSRALRDALEHRSFPFQRMVQQTGTKRELGQSPLFQTSVAFENLPDRAMLSLLFDPDPNQKVVRGSITFRALPLGSQAGHTDLDCVCAEIDGALVGHIDYSPELFSDSTIDRLYQHLLRLMESVCDQPDTAIGRLPLLSEKERQQMLSEWNQTEQPFPTDKCIHELFEEQAKRTPTAIAVEYEGESLSYQELDHRATVVANRLVRHGVRADVLVPLCVENSAALLVGIFGILKAGGAYVPIDPSLPKDRIAFVLKDCGAKIVLTTAAHKEKLSALAVQVLCLDAALRIPEDDVVIPADVCTSDSLAYVIFTSGSTGRPKGVAVRQRSVVNLCWAHHHAIIPSTSMRWALTAPAVFDGSVLQIFGALLFGRTLVVIEESLRRDADGLLACLESRQIELTDSTPALLDMMVHAGLGHRAGIKLQTLLCGGEALPRALVSELAATPLGQRLLIFNLYGPTECCVDATAMKVDAAALDDSSPTVAIGRPTANVQIYILDQQMQPVPIGVPGELHIGGEGVARGYLNRAELTEEKFIRNPFGKGKWDRLYKTGDLARYREDGNIEYLGRMDQQVKLRGYRIELGEIEAVLAQQEAVASSVVMLREDVPGDKRLVAYVVLRQGMQLDEKSLRASLGARLPEYMIPSVFVPLPQLPLTTNGKVNRSALAAPVVSRTPAVHSAPRSPLEAQLCEAFASVLRLDRVGRDEDFFELGGDSLKTVRLVSLASQRNIPLSVRDVFAYPTVAQLSTAVTQLSQSSCLVSLQEGQGDEALILLPGSFGTLFAMGMLSRSLSLSLPIFGLTTPPHAGGMPMPSSLDEFCMRYVKEMEAGKLPRTVWLIGHSVGGVLAILLGDRLRQLGWQVAGVLLLDSWEPGRLGALPLPSLLSELCTMLGLPVPFANDPALSDSVMTKQTISAVQRAGLGGSSPESFVRALLDSATGLQSLLHRVHIGIPQVPIHLLRADGDIQPEPDTGRRGWTIPLRSVTPLRGNHFGILRMPYLAETAQAIVRIVKRKEGGETEA